MPRPRICRRVGSLPEVNFFKPAGVRAVELKEVVLTLGEYEAVRLKDLEGIDQDEAAKKIGVSQPTFHRLVMSARKKIAEALVRGKAIRVEGGHYKVARPGTGMKRRFRGGR